MNIILLKDFLMNYYFSIQLLPNKNNQIIHLPYKCKTKSFKCPKARWTTHIKSTRNTKPTASKFAKHRKRREGSRKLRGTDEHPGGYEDTLPASLSSDNRLPTEESAAYDTLQDGTHLTADN